MSERGMNMDVILIMCLGILVGRLFIPDCAKKSNERISLMCTFLLIFSMGVMLGKKEHFLEELSSLGFSSLLFFILPTVFSIIIVFLLTKKLMKKKSENKTKKSLEVER